MSDRGMKKWVAYKALVEQYPALDKTVNKEKDAAKPTLSVDKEEEINEILVNYHGQLLEISYFHNKRILKVQITIKKIDVYQRKLIPFEGTSINIDDIVDIVSLK